MTTPTSKEWVFKGIGNLIGSGVDPGLYVGQFNEHNKPEPSQFKEGAWIEVDYPDENVPQGMGGKRVRVYVATKIRPDV